jgi:hypothetical protein
MTFSIRILISEAGPDKKKVSVRHYQGRGKASKPKLLDQKVNSRLFELARVLVCLNHIARFIVNTNHGIV